MPSTSRSLLAVVFLLLLILASAQAAQPAAPQSVGAAGPKIWLQANQPLALRHVGAPQAVQALASGKAQPLALAGGDFDGDGIDDLAVGYATAGGGVLAIHRGNLDAFAPQSQASFQAIAGGQYPAPFLPDVRVISLPVRPDFVVVGGLNGQGYPDLVVAARGDSNIYLLTNDGKGKFAAPKAINAGGPITAVAAAVSGRRGAFSELLVGISDQSGSYMMVYAGTLNGLGGVTVLPVPAPVSSIQFGDLGDSGLDAVFLSGGQIQILRLPTLQLVPVSLPVTVRAFALGSFIDDRNPGLQIALAASDGSVQIAAHNEFDPRPYRAEEWQAIQHAGKLRTGPNPLVPARSFPASGWTIVEGFPGVASLPSGQTPLLFRTRISSNGPDDVMVLGNGQLALVSHQDTPEGANTFLPGQISLRAYSGSPVAAVPMRINVDGRPGVVAIHQGEIAPSMSMPIPDPTFTVNRTDDPVPVSPITNACNGVANDCSLREAILRANATAGTDTITIPAGTYTLTLPKVAGDFTGQHGTLEVTDSVNIVGAGQNTTIIQGGALADLSDSVDKVFSFNQDITAFTNASVSVSNLTIQHGRNRGDCCVTQDGFGGAFDFDTGGNGTPGTGNATLTLTNVTLQNNAIFNGQGGGFTMFNTLNGTGFATLTNVIVQNNDGTATASCCGDGAGGVIDARSHIVMSNVQVLTNHTHTTGTVTPTGGGLFFSGQHTQPQSHITGGSISGNTATGMGGGINNQATLLIDGGTVISNNTSGNEGASANFAGGGGIVNQASDGMTLSKVTITGNSTAGDGGGLFTGGGTGIGPVVINFSRFAGNSATHNPTSNNLVNVTAATGGNQVTATNNWWGTNVPSSTIVTAASTCPAPVNTNAACFDPFIVLTHTASPATIKINQSTTLTGDMSKDNHGSGAALAGNLDVLNALPITFNNAVDGSIPNAQPEALSAGAQATATFNAGGVAGGGKADATVDQATVTANIAILEPLQIVKSFNPTTVAVSASSALTFSVTNPNVIAVDANFTDTFPANLVVAATPAATNTCGGTFSPVAGAGSVTFTNATLPVGSCTITVNVSSAVDNVYSNSVTINSTAAGTGAQSTSSASLTVINPPTIAKNFGAATIPLNGSTSLTFTISNTNTTSTLNGIAFTDSLPAGLIVATPGNLNSTCSGTATAVDGSGSVSLSGASLAPGAFCTVSLNVTGTTSGVKANSVQASSTDGGTGNTSNASVTVVSPPVIIKAFGAASIPLNGSTSLTFTIQNNNTTTTLTGIGFSDTLPAGLVISTPNGLTGSCGGGTITATQATNVISLSGASLAQSSSCTFSVNVTGTAAGSQNNTTGNVTSTEGGTGGTASASLSVVAPPSIAKAFNPTTIALNATTSLTFTITNPAANTVALTGVAFTDTLPTGLTVANASATVCGGTLTTTAPTGIALSGATIAVNSQCQFSVTVTGAASGQYTNTTGAVTSTNGGTGNTASANLTVAVPPSITKVFGAASVPLNGTTSLTFTINNPNAGVALTGLAFTDNLPAGLVVATPNNLTNTCGGTATAVAGSGSVSLSAGTLAASASCTVSVDVTGTTAGVKNNSVQVTSTEGGTGNTSNASITVIGPPVIIKAFGAASVPLGGSTSLTFTIQNNTTTTTLTGIGFSDTLPAGLVISTPNGLTGSCGGGTITATQATNVISLTGASLTASASCTFSVNVTGTAAGTENNTTGQVTSTEGGTGGTASASLDVEGPPSIAKAFNPAAIAVNGTSTLTLTITNPAANAAALTGVAVTDTLPAGLVVATPNGLTNTCGGTATATAGSGSITLTGGTVAVSSSCTLTVNVTSPTSGTFINTTGAVSSTNGGTGNTATASLTVQPADLTITKVHNGTFTRGQTGATYTITVHNIGVGPTVGTVTVVDTLPNVANTLVPTALTGTGWTCTLATLTCTRSDALAPGASYPPITLTVNIPANIGNPFTNTVTVSGGGETNSGNDTGSDTVTLVDDFTIGATPASNTVTAGGSAMYTVTVTPNNGFFPQAVTLSVMGLPINSVAVLLPNPLNGPLNAATNSTLTINTTPRTASLTRPAGPFGTRPQNQLAMALSLGGFGFLGIVFVGLGNGGRRRKRLLFLLLALVLLGVVAAGCGGTITPGPPGNNGTPPGTYTITITGTANANGGTVTHSTTVTLVVN